MGKKNDLKNNSKTSKMLEEFLKNKAKNHRHFKVYTTLDRVKGMIKDSAIYLTNGANWNDLQDKERLNNQEYDVIRYAKCFSFSQSENVAMWMLYGGVNRRGAMIDFPQTVICNLIKEKQPISLGHFKDEEFCQDCTLGPNEYDIELTDILYFGEDKKEGCYTIKRSDERAEGIKDSIVNRISVRKGYAWSYENECRLIVSIKREKIPSNESNVIKIILNCENSKLVRRVYHSPNSELNDIYKLSTLHTRMEWDLCRNCSTKKAVEGGASCQNS